ncbi:MAG: MOSC domain-containing protein [Dokdonella sp.]|nr:MOSC domain-containing protein [Dokdonella sp.]
MAIALRGLYLYPLKSCAPLAQSDAVVEPRGLAGDRRWMVVDATGRFVTGRQQRG